MAKKLVSEFSIGPYEAITAHVGDNFAVPGVDIDHTYTYGGGKMSTEANVALKINGAILNIKVSFDLRDRLDLAQLPKLPRELSKNEHNAIRHMYKSEFYLLCASTRKMDVNLTYKVREDSERCFIQMRCGSYTVYGITNGATCHMLARALDIGVGANQQSEMDALAREFAPLIAAEELAAKTGSKLKKAS